MGCLFVQVRFSSAQSAPPETIVIATFISCEKCVDLPSNFQSRFLALTWFFAPFSATFFLRLRLSLFCLWLALRFSRLWRTPGFLWLRRPRRLSGLWRAPSLLCLRLTRGWLAALPRIRFFALHRGVRQRLLLALSRRRVGLLRAAPWTSVLIGTRYNYSRLPLTRGGILRLFLA